MATYMHTYQPTGYQTNAYGRPVPENYYAMSTPQPLYPAPPIEHYPILVPRYWAPDQNQAIAGTHQRVLPGGMLETPPGAWAPLAPAHASAAFFALGQYYAQPAPALPPPPQGHPDTYYLLQPRPPAAPPSHTPPSPLGHQRVKAYIQQCDKVLQLLRISLAEFARRAQALLISLGHNDLSGTPKQWANHLLEFHELYQCGAISEDAQNTLQVDLHLQDKLCALVDEIHTSPTPWRFEDPVDPARLFHVQHEEPIKLWDPVPAPVPRQQEELNAASNILKALNPTRGLFDQPAACTIGLSMHPHGNSFPSAFCTWRQPADVNPCLDAPPHLPPANNDNASTHILSYINELEASGSGSAPSSGAPAPEFQRNCPPHFDLCHPCGNAPPLRNNPPPLQQPTASGAPRPPLFQEPPQPPAPLGPSPSQPFDTNPGPPPPGGLPPP
ncbi:hypothetical protein C0993_009657 [Termitomyces sp. T159_Od127]|nr:hypothetical protein C0993_009657 [Termitomyces sp. T159_Od127]